MLKQELLGVHDCLLLHQLDLLLQALHVLFLDVTLHGLLLDVDEELLVTLNAIGLDIPKQLRMLL